MNNGNVNNNNKSSTNYVRAVSEFQGKFGRPVVSLEDIIKAYYLCRKNKRGTLNALSFEVNALSNCYKLWEEVNNGAYTIGKSICFIVEYPVKREVFAGEFRDRVVQTYLVMKLEPIFEDYLPQVMCSNRKGKGTSAAIGYAQQMLDDTPKDWYVYKFDLQGFFMSIDKRVLNVRLQEFITERYHGDDKPAIQWLVEKVVMHCPQYNCVRKSPLSAWEGLPKNKSLFNQDRYHGIAIGNHTSQVFANFYLACIIFYLRDKGFINCVEYVDDIVVYGEKDKLIALSPELRCYLRDELGIVLHPRKKYLQPKSHGVKFVGAVIKPGRTYVSGRSIDRLRGKLLRLPADMDINKVAATINSYYGLFGQYHSYNIRKQYASIILDKWGEKLYFTNDFRNVKIKKRFTEKWKNIERVRRMRKINYNQGGATLL